MILAGYFSSAVHLVLITQPIWPPMTDPVYLLTGTAKMIGQRGITLLLFETLRCLKLNFSGYVRLIVPYKMFIFYFDRKSTMAAIAGYCLI